MCDMSNLFHYLESQHDILGTFKFCILAVGCSGDSPQNSCNFAIRKKIGTLLASKSGPPTEQIHLKNQNENKSRATVPLKRLTLILGSTIGLIEMVSPSKACARWWSKTTLWLTKNTQIQIFPEWMGELWRDVKPGPFFKGIPNQMSNPRISTPSWLCKNWRSADFWLYSYPLTTLGRNPKCLQAVPSLAPSSTPPPPPPHPILFSQVAEKRGNVLTN
jgi:hypothetical protein